MTLRRVVITGAAGNIGAKLRAHLETAGGYQLCLFDIDPSGDPAVTHADLSVYDERWASLTRGADVIVHLAADPRPWADWDTLTPRNIDATRNVYQAAARHDVARVVFASSIWAMRGRIHDAGPIHPEGAAADGVAYAESKLLGEEIGRETLKTDGVSTIALRLGAVRAGENPPAPVYEPWEDGAWMSNRDCCHGLECAINADIAGFHLLNLMSENPGSRWSLAETRAALGYRPKDGAPVPRGARPEPRPPSIISRAGHKLARLLSAR